MRPWRATAPLALALAIASEACVLYCPSYATPGCLTVAKIQTESDRDTLIDWLSNDERSWVREEAARVLGLKRYQVARAALEARLVDGKERSYVRAAAAEALGALADPQSLALLTGIALEPSAPPDLKVALVLALCRFESPEAMQTITPLSSNDDLLVSAVAASSVATNCGRKKNKP